MWFSFETIIHVAHRFICNVKGMPIRRIYIREECRRQYFCTAPIARYWWRGKIGRQWYGLSPRMGSLTMSFTQQLWKNLGTPITLRVMKRFMTVTSRSTVGTVYFSSSYAHLSEDFGKSLNPAKSICCIDWWYSSLQYIILAQRGKWTEREQ